VSSDQVLLSMSGVHAGYGSADVLHGIDLTLNRGQITAIMGANGAGKTTLLKAMMGLIPLSAGRIELAGQLLTGQDPTAISNLGMALVPEGRGVFASQSVESNLLAAGYPIRRDRRRLREAVKAIYERFPMLAERRKAKAGMLSGGQARVLSIAMALVTEPQLLLLDEPSLGLAPIVIDDVFDAIETFRAEGKTVLLVEQNADVALAAADHAHIMHLGRITVSGSADDLAHNDELESAYLGFAKRGLGATNRGGSAR
jgi:ABC-type branched-subunit amino acid transport system ATPase component